MEEIADPTEVTLEWSVLLRDLDLCVEFGEDEHAARWLAAQLKSAAVLHSRIVFPWEPHERQLPRTAPVTAPGDEALCGPQLLDMSYHRRAPLSRALDLKYREGYDPEKLTADATTRPCVTLTRTGTGCTER